eukprot:3848244-Alexandrium_andersonii.AAC.1
MCIRDSYSSARLTPYRPRSTGHSSCCSCRMPMQVAIAAVHMLPSALPVPVTPVPSSSRSCRIPASG